jgi:transposase
LSENHVHFIDAFIEAFSLQTLGFSVQSIKAEGRPCFDTKIFFKIYLYGYLNGLRSSRKLEKDCARNIELRWLLCAIIPNYHSISDFRKQNPSGLKKLFNSLFLFLRMPTRLVTKSSLLMEPKAERTIARKQTSIKKK